MDLLSCLGLWEVDTWNTAAASGGFHSPPLIPSTLGTEAETLGPLGC
jgi:hypothetical protein